jgi:hypothetical protein
MISTFHIVLAIKPISGNFVQNALKHGVAGINVDGCRISGPKGEGVWGTSNKTINTDRKFNTSPEMGEYRSEAHSAGRWPPNVILGHLDGCRRVGTKKISGTATGNGDATIGEESNGVVRSLRRGNFTNRTDEDGKETVEAWECQDGCAVKTLDQQSGVLKSGGSGGIRKNGGGWKQTSEFISPNNPMLPDSGGASRFFKQVKS